MLDATLPIERLVLFARGFASAWDITRADLSPVAYRRMLLRMLSRAGFQRWETTDPEVLYEPYNFLAVRSGRDVPSASLASFMEHAASGNTDPWW